MLVKLALLLALCHLAFGDDGGFCGVDKPAEGESCSGNANADANSETRVKDKVIEFVGREMTANETLTWQRLQYGKLHFTNDADWAIRDELDYADEFIVAEPDQAIELFKDILKKEPRSVRAFYALTRAMEFKNTTGWSEEEKKDWNLQIMDRFLELVKRSEFDESVLWPVYNSAAQMGLVFAATKGLADKKIEMLELALSLKSQKNERYHLLLLQDYYLLEDYEKALIVVELAVDRFHLSNHFKFLKGVILKKLDRKKEGNKVLRAIETNPDDAYVFGSDVIGFCADLEQRNRTADVDLIYKEASKVHLFMSRYQRPLEALPDLESKPIWSLEDDVGLTTHTDEIEKIKANLADIKAEALELRKNESLWSVADGELLQKGSWLELPLYTWAKKRVFFCSLAPKTCAILKEFSAASGCYKCTSKFNVIGSGTRVRPHTGPTNGRLRIHVPLLTPKDESKARMRVAKNDVVTWKEGEIVVFDDSYEHEVFNESEDEERIVLSIDIPHPDLADQTTKFNSWAKAVFVMV